MKHFSKSYRKPSAIAFACASLVGVSAQAQQSPYSAAASLRMTSDSNVARSQVAERDTITSSGVKFGIDQGFGRQQLALGLEVNSNRFAKFNQNNHVGYAVNGKLDWETVDRLSGTVSVDSRRARFVDVTTPTSDLNLQSINNIGLQARLGNVTAITFEGGVSANQTSYSAAAYQRNNYSQYVLNGGVRVRPVGGVSLWTGLRHTSGKYPNFSSSEADAIRRNDLDFSVDYRPTGASSLNGRLSLTRERHSALNSRDYKSWTGALGWNWSPTGKLKLGLNLNRDSSVGSLEHSTMQLVLNPSFDSSTGGFGYTTRQYTFESNNTRVSSRLGLTADWEMTSTLSLTAGWSSTHRTLDDSFAPSQLQGSLSGSDNTRSASLGVKYVPVRNIETGCSLVWIDRSTSENMSTTVTYPYKATTASCYGQVYMR